MAAKPARTRRWVVLLIALFAILLAVGLTWVGLPASSPPVPEPVPDLAAPAATAAPRPAPPPRPTSEPKPAPPTPERWHRGGAHVPECWPIDFEPEPLDPTRRCTVAGRIELCTVGEARVPHGLDAAEVDRLISLAEQASGLEHQSRLTVLLYERKAFKRAREARQLRTAVAGWFDGHVHVGTSPVPTSTLRVLRHELMHAVMAPAIGCAPRSVHEGVAEWFEGDAHVDAWAYLLWRGMPMDARTLDAMVTSNDGYEVGLAYAESAARVRHAVASGGEEALQDWLAQIEAQDLSTAAPAWRALEHATEEPVMSTLAPDLLGEPWAEDLAARLDATSVACAYTFRFADPLDYSLYGRAAQPLECALLDRDPDSPEISDALARAMVEYEETLERISNQALAFQQKHELK